MTTFIIYMQLLGIGLGLYAIDCTLKQILLELRK